MRKRDASLFLLDLTEPTVPQTFHLDAVETGLPAGALLTFMRVHVRFRWSKWSVSQRGTGVHSMLIALAVRSTSPTLNSILRRLGISSPLKSPLGSPSHSLRSPSETAPTPW